jgi:ribosomal protein S18 acetylase RimI-like enzyme
MDQKSISKDCLKGYKRYHKTKRVKYVKNQTLLEKDVTFVDDWDQVKLESLCQYFKDVNGLVIFAYDQTKVVGFIVVDWYEFDGYVNVPYVHVDKTYRGLGIGQSLMLFASKLVKDNGLDKLYLSTHPDIAAQAFYANMGCILAKNINQDLYDIEPLDIQLERALDYEDINRRIIEVFMSYNSLNEINYRTLLDPIRDWFQLEEEYWTFMKESNPLYECIYNWLKERFDV